MAIGLRSSKLKICAHYHAALLFLLAILSLSGGQALSEPAPSNQNSSIQGENFVYVTQPGDTLLGIKAKFATDNVRWLEMAKLNKISNDKRLPAGKKLLFPISWLASQPGAAKINMVSGKATVNGQAITAGMLISESARISTEDNSAVVLELSDGSKLRVGSASTIVVDRLKQYHSDQIVEARVRLERGRVEALVTEQRKKPFDILTPGATAAVRGTHFGVTLDEPSNGSPASLASVDVGKGKVDWVGVKTAAKEYLPGGFGSSVNEVGLISKPEALLPPIEVNAFPKEVSKTISTLSFSPLAGATTYRVQVASDSNFEKLLYENVVPKPRLFLLSDKDGDHYIRVNAITANLIEGMTATAKVSVQARPIAPDGMSPPDATGVFNNAATLSWADTPGNSYRLQAAKDENFKNPILDSVTQLQNANLTLSPGKTFWRVASIQNGKQGPFSDAKHIELKLAPNSPVPKTSDDIVELNSDVALSEKGNQLEVYLAKDAEFKTALEIKKLTVSPAKFALPAGKYFIKTRYLIEGFKPDAVPFGPVQNITMVEPVRDTYGNSVRSGDGTSIILGR
jgi:FecR protein/LysM domain